MKYYHHEAGSEEVLSLFSGPDRTIRISSLGFLEIQSALAIKVRTRASNRQAADLQRAKLVRDVNFGRIAVYSVTDAHFVAAERLIGRYAFDEPLKTLDSIQLAVALDLLSQGLLDVFIAADKVLANIAAREGLKVFNPNSPAAQQ